MLSEGHMQKWHHITSILLAMLVVQLLPSPVFGQDRPRVVIVPKLVGISYYDVVKHGIDAAARELPEIEVVWLGPSQNQVEKQIEVLERIIPTRPAVIAVAANDP